MTDNEPPITPDDTYQVTIRVEVRRVLTGKKIGRDGVGTFDIDSPIMPVKLGEAAAEAARMLADGKGSPMALGVRTRAALRELARRPEVQRGVAVIAAAMRVGAATVEAKAAETAARVIHLKSEEDPLGVGPT